MEIRHLRYFMAAVEAGSIRGGAERARVAQPALSRRIRDLERGLACTLLERHAGGVRPTRAGAYLYDEALALLDGLDRATRRIRRMGVEQARPVRLGLVRGASRYGFVREAIAGSGRGIAYLRAASASLAAALGEARLDLTLLYERHPGSGGALRERLIHRERYVAAVHPGHPLSEAGALPLDRLSGEPLVWLSRFDNPDRHDHLMQQCRLHGLEPRIGHGATSHEEQIELTVASGGVCLTPASTMLSVPPGRLRFRPLTGFATELHLTLAWRTDDAAPGDELLAAFHAAIDRHQAGIRTGEPAWVRLDGHRTVLLPEDDARV